MLSLILKTVRILFTIFTFYITYVMIFACRYKYKKNNDNIDPPWLLFTISCISILISLGVWIIPNLIK